MDYAKLGMPGKWETIWEKTKFRKPALVIKTNLADIIKALDVISNKLST